MSPGRFLAGVAATLGPPLVCLGLLLGVAAFHNSRPQPGRVTCDVNKLWTLPGGSVMLNIARAPIIRKQALPPPLDVVIVVDQSESMMGFAPYLPDAVFNATDALNRPDFANRFALVYFSDADHAAGANQDNIVSPWTREVGAITEAAQAPLMGGGTESEQIISALRTLLPDNSLGLQRVSVVILLSDTQIAPPESIAAEADRLRSKGVRFYVLLPPGQMEQSFANEIAGEDNVASMSDEAGLKDLLTRTVAELLTQASSGTEATVSIHPRTFALDDEHAFGRSWSLEESTLTSRTKFMSDAGVLYQLPLEPQRLGLWLIGERASEITALDNLGRPTVESCGRMPMVLVTPPWLLFLAFLPALLWLSHAIRFWLQKPREYLPAPPALTMVEPVVRTLSLPQTSARENEKQVPTLVVGVGERGRRAIEILDRDLADSISPPAVTLAAVSNRTPATMASTDRVTTFAMPRESAATAHYLSAPGETLSDETQWFDADAHRDLSRDQLDASAGGSSNRAINRFAFLHWLHAQLRSRLQRLGAEFARSTSGAGQILIVADVDDAFASAGVIDIANILRSSSAQRPIDIGLLLLSEWGPKDDLNRNSFLRELESSAFIDARRTLAHGGGEGRAPFDHLFLIDGSAGSSEQAASDAIVMLMSRSAAQVIYTDSRSARQSKASLGRGEILAPMRMVVAKIGFRSRSLAEAVTLEIVQRWLVASTLGGADASSEGGYRLRLARATAAILIGELIKGTHGVRTDASRLLLIAAEEHGDVSELLSAMRRAGSQCNDTLLRMTAQLLSELVASIGRKDFGMSDVLAVLSSLIDTLGGTGFERRLTLAGGLGADLQSIRQTVVPAITQFSEQLDEWVATALECISQAREAQDQLLAQDFAILERGLGRKVNRALIDQLAVDLNAQLTGGMDRADAADWISLCARIDAGQMVVEGRIAIGQPVASNAPEEFVDTLMKRAEIGVSAMQPYTLEWLLRRHSKSVDLAAELRLDAGPQGHAIVLKPQAAVSGTDVVKQLIACIPPLSGTTHEQDVFESADPRWVRRIAFAEAAMTRSSVSSASAFVTTPEQAAERARERLQSEHDVKAAVFPPSLRAAFADKAAIQRFARLHAAGRIVRVLDDLGRSQWALASRVLTYGPEPTLADALASYVLSGASDDAPMPVTSQAIPLDPADRDALSDSHNVDAITRAVLSAALRGDL